MGLNCPQRNNYISCASRTGGLEALAREAFEDIRTSFQCRVEYGVPDTLLGDVRYRLSNTADPSLLLLRNPRTGIGRFIDGTKRVYVLNHDEWIANQRLTKGPTFIGQYIYEPCVVLLHSFDSSPISWCRNVLVHETLHSVSIYSRIWDNPQGIIARHRTLIEGITECLTGYVLLKKRPDCYASWKSSVQGKCVIAYRDSTKLFCSLAQKIGISPIASFYLSLANNFRGPWGQLVQGIHEAGFATFTFAMDETTAYRESQFREVCVKEIPGFKKIYDSLAKALDFSQIP
jgi:hypothetical protein